MSTILTCTDGSLYASSVYRHAAWAATRVGSSIHLLHVIEHHESVEKRDLSGSIGFNANAELLAELAALDESNARVARLRGKAILEDAAAQLGISGVGGTWEILSTQRHGSLVDTVAEFEKDASLIIIGKRGEHADFSKGHLGSNLERVVRSANIPVLVAAREFNPVSRFTVAFDGGQSALKAIHYLGTQPLLKGAECHIIAIGKAGTDLSRALDDAATALTGAGYKVTAELLPGDADEAIAAKVKDASSDLLVMGAYGHSRVRQFILGSTTTNLIRTCHVPVLLFR